MQLKSKKTLETAQSELVFYKEFRDEIISLTVQGGRICFSGVAAYGIIDVYEALCHRSALEGQEFYSKFKAKLCYEKYFTNIQTKRVLYFNDQFALILPFRLTTEIFLYNIVTDQYTLLRLTDHKTPEKIATEIKRKFINLLLV